jgi:hypothetical protein
VIDNAWSLATEPARDPATPPDEVIELPQAGRLAATPELTDVEVPTSSPSINDSLKENASPAVVMVALVGV